MNRNDPTLRSDLSMVLYKHRLLGVDCDDERKADRARCACEVDLGWWPQVGLASFAWAQHVAKVFSTLTKAEFEALRQEFHGLTASGTPIR